MTVHNHGVEEGQNSGCNEVILANGIRKGECCLTLRDVYDALSKEQKNFVRFLVNATLLATAWIDVSQVVACRPDYKQMWSEFKDYEKNVVYALMHDVLNRKTEQNE